MTRFISYYICFCPANDFLAFYFNDNDKFNANIIQYK